MPRLSGLHWLLACVEICSKTMCALGGRGWLVASVCCVSMLVSWAGFQVAKSTGENFAKNSNAIFLETSAKDNINVHDLFRTIGEELVHTWQLSNMVAGVAGLIARARQC